jgi:hypothetical protein
MWAACVVTVIVLSAVAFMLSFLVTLLREGSPSICYWVVPDHWEAQSENKRYARKESDSVLVPLDVRPAFDGVGWRSIRSSRIAVFDEHGFEFDCRKRAAGNAG